MKSLLFAILGLAACSQAQSITLPSAAALSRPSPNVNVFPVNSQIFFTTPSTTVPHDSHTQSMYDVSDIASPFAVWSSVGFRRPVGVLNANPACTTTVTILMMVGPNASSAASTFFALNLAASPTTVLSAPISLPAEANPTSWPAPWHTYMFTTPFTFLKSSGAALVVDIVQTGNSATASWLLESTVPDIGNRYDNSPGYQAGCKFNNGKANKEITPKMPAIGGSWSVTYGSLLGGVSGFGVLGAIGAGGSWLGYTLPVDLGPLGAPNCKWAASADVIVPLLANAAGSAAWPMIPVPNVPALVGGTFYDHSAFLDPLANTLGVVTGYSSKWGIGSGLGAPAATLYATGNNATAASGTLQAQTVATIQLN